MFSQQIFRIRFFIISFSLLCNIRSSIGTFRLQDLKINEYYVSSSQIFSSENNSRVRKRETGKNYFVFPLKLTEDGEELRVFIKTRNSDVVLENTQIFHVANTKESNESTTKHYIMENSDLCEGYILENPHNSSVNGYIKENYFYGHVIVNNTLYYVDELSRLEHVNNGSSNDVQQKRNAVIYAGNSIIFTGFDDMFPVQGGILTIRKQDFKRMFQSWKGKGMLCPLLVVIDYSFLTVTHRGNKEAATYQILFALEEVNAIFRSTDFDGDGTPDNVGFYIKKIVIISSEDNLYYITKYATYPLDVNDFLQKFRGYKELGNHCIGIIFTAQKFLLRTLGASYSADHRRFEAAGGICDYKIPGRGSYNVLVVTVVTETYNPIPQIIFEVTIAHELGHSFGSSHDEENNTNCYGYIMSAKTFHDYDTVRMRLQFSSCSRETMTRTMVVKGRCFETVKTSFCGNGLVESDEQCDCGLTRDCLQKDPCCIPRRTKDLPCRVNKKMGFECHPSQGACCTDQCKYSTNLKDYVDCNQFDDVCPCTKPDTRCRCGINGICIESECHSTECTRLGLNECQCAQIKLKDSCSACCEYKNQCLPVLAVTNQITQEAAEDKIITQLFSSWENPQYSGKNWISKRFCRATECVNLNFYQSRRGDFCLFNGNLGVCNKTYDCKVIPHKQVFPSLRTNNGVFFHKLSFLNIAFYFLFLGFKNILFAV